MTETEKYLRNVAAGLYRLPDVEKNEILAEIQNYINEALKQMESEQAVLDKLGSPLKLAQSYVNQRYIKSEGMEFTYIMNNFSFYLAAGMVSIVVVPVLLIMAAVFALCPVFAIGYTVAALFINLPNIVNIGTTVFSGIPAVIAAVISGVIFFILAVICWKLLKKYIIFVSGRYRELRLGK